MRFAVVILFSLLFGAKNALAQVDAPAALIPSGLNPGDEFFVIFTTSTTAHLCHGRVFGDPASLVVPIDDTAAINLANTAAAAGSLTSGVAGWQALYIHERADALGTITDTVAAAGVAFNNNVTQPIYNVLGDLVANNRTDLFDGSSTGGTGTPLINTFNIDENGNPVVDFAYTGFDEFGNKAVGPAPGNLTEAIGAGGGGCRIGRPSDSDGDWADFANSANPRGVYVLSPLMRVPLASTNATGVPVAPYGFALVLGLLMLVGVGRKLKKY